MVADPGRERCHHRSPVRRQPPLPAIAHHAGFDLEILDGEALIPLEPGAGWDGFWHHDPSLDCHPRPLRPAPPLGWAVSCRWLLLRRLVHPGRRGRLDIRLALQTLQPRDLLALLQNNLLQRRHLLKKRDHQRLQSGGRKTIKIIGRRHPSIES